MLYKAIYGFAQPLLRLFYKIFFFADVKGLENVPKDTGVIICGNHISNHDGLLIAGFTPRQMNFLAKKEIFKFKALYNLLYGLGLRPVERNGSDIAVVKAALSILKEQGGLVIFPEGKRNLEDVNQTKDGAVVMAIKTQVPIIPVHIIGIYRLFSGLKVIFGKPYDLSQYYGKRLSQEENHKITLDLMKTINNLGEVKNSEN